MIFSGATRGQFAAIARLRWCIFINSLRTLRGRLEMVSKVFFTFGFSVMGIGGAISLGVVSYIFVTKTNSEWLAALLWVIFVSWQLFPVLATTFTEAFDSTSLLRFPLTYSSYFIIRLAYGALDPGTLIGFLWLCGICVGVVVAKPLLGLWAAPVLLVFALLNLLLSRVVFAWLERWLARRRTREIMGFIFFLFIISFQFIGPMMQRFWPESHQASQDTVAVASRFLPVERALPPGLAASAIAHAVDGKPSEAVGAGALLCVYPLAFFWLLNLRLRAQYHGENLGEAVAARAAVAGKPVVRPGLSVPGFSNAISAIVEKEFRYLLRSGPMLFIFVMPVVVLLIFRVTPGRSGHSLLSHTADLAFPIGAAYSLLILTNLVFNSFGGDAVGVQAYFAVPVRFRDVLIAKNLAQASIIGVEMLMLFVAVCLLFEPPTFSITLATLAGMLFALLVSLTVGNILSVYSPRKIDLGSMGRQKPPTSTQFAALGCQFVIFALGAVTLLMARYFNTIWVAAVFFLVLAAIALAVYLAFLPRTEKMAMDRREIIIAELSKT